MKTVGVLGGIGSGKSEVTRILAELGAAVFDADAAGHKALLKPEIKARIRERFGSKVFDIRGEIDRRRLAEVVFSESPDGGLALADLERITHPEIRRQLEEDRKTHQKDGNIPIWVLDAPVMIKAGWVELCDHILFVEADRDRRLARVAARGWSEKEFEAREARQEKLDDKRKLAEYIVNNDQDLLHLRRQVVEVWQRLTEPDLPGLR